jgi:hypothetical protein
VTARNGTQAYRALQARARKDGRATEELLVLYAHEGFLRRLSLSDHYRAFVLKGGMLMAVLHARRPTRDADLSVHGLPSDHASVRRFITDIARTNAPDGLEFNTTKITTTTMREDAEYHGVRVVMPATLATAQIKVQLDLSFGDPIDAHEITYPTLLDDHDIRLLGYPIDLTLAEKISTMMVRGQANTRDRDFADVALLSRVHAIDAHTLHSALTRTAEHRVHPIIALSSTLDGHADNRQSAWMTLRQRSALDGLPLDFNDLIAEVVRFVDPLVKHGAAAGTWQPRESRWSELRREGGAQGR